MNTQVPQIPADEKPARSAPEHVDDSFAASVIETATQTMDQFKAIVDDVDQGLEATLDLGRAELGLFKMGLVRVALLSLGFFVLLTSLWVVALAGTFAALQALTGSAVQAFGLMSIGLVVSMFVVWFIIRRWLQRMSFPGVRRQVNALVDQWQGAS